MHVHTHTHMHPFPLAWGPSKSVRSQPDGIQALAPLQINGFCSNRFQLSRPKTEIDQVDPNRSTGRCRLSKFQIKRNA